MDRRPGVTGDLEGELKRFLTEEADAAPSPAPFSPGIRRPIRRRRAVAAVMSAGVAVALSVGLVVGLQAAFRPANVERFALGGSLLQKAALVNGIQIERPDGWTLIQLGGERVIGGERTWPVLQLTNFDGGPSSWDLCPASKGEIPNDGVLLHLRRIVDAEASGLSGWPVDLNVDDRRQGPCGFGAYTRWTYERRVYEAFFASGAAAEEGTIAAARETFRGMNFEHLEWQDLRMQHRPPEPCVPERPMTPKVLRRCPVPEDARRMEHALFNQPRLVLSGVMYPSSLGGGLGAVVALPASAGLSPPESATLLLVSPDGPGTGAWELAVPEGRVDAQFLCTGKGGEAIAVGGVTKDVARLEVRYGNGQKSAVHIIDVPSSVGASVNAFMGQINTGNGAQWVSRDAEGTVVGVEKIRRGTCGTTPADGASGRAGSGAPDGEPEPRIEEPPADRLILASGEGPEGAWEVFVFQTEAGPVYGFGFAEEGEWGYTRQPLPPSPDPCDIDPDDIYLLYLRWEPNEPPVLQFAPIPPQVTSVTFVLNDGRSVPADIIRIPDDQAPWDMFVVVFDGPPDIDVSEIVIEGKDGERLNDPAVC